MILSALEKSKAVDDFVHVVLGGSGVLFPGSLGKTRSHRRCDLRDLLLVRLPRGGHSLVGREGKLRGIDRRST